MTGFEAIAKISELLARLIKLTKDRETGALVQQIQEHQLLIHQELMQKDAEIVRLKAQLQEKQPALDTCPYCRRPTGMLQRMTDIPGLEIHGLKTGHYKCSDPKCGKTYEKQIR